MGPCPGRSGPRPGTRSALDHARSGLGGHTSTPTPSQTLLVDGIHTSWHLPIPRPFSSTTDTHILLFVFFCCHRISSSPLHYTTPHHTTPHHTTAQSTFPRQSRTATAYTHRHDNVRYVAIQPRVPTPEHDGQHSPAVCLRSAYTHRHGDVRYVGTHGHDRRWSSP